MKTVDTTTVEGYLTTLLKERGFHKRRLKFTKAVHEADLEVEIQRSTWGKETHFLNFALVYRPDACQLAHVRTGIGIWGRVESLDASREQRYLEALDDRSSLSPHERQQRLLTLIDELFLPLVDSVQTIEGAKAARRRGELAEVHAPQAETKWEL
jgi:hypothetical protein